MTCTIITGSYRSGTSAIAGIVHKLGIFMGDSFDEPTRNNPEGYFEDLVFKRLLDEDIPDEQIFTNPDLLQFIENRESKHSHWGLKNPRLCVCLNRFVSCLKTPHRLIVCQRDPVEVAKSMARALDDAGFERFLPLVKYFQNSLKDELVNYKGKILTINYPEDIASPLELVTRIAGFCDVPVTQEAIDHIRI